MTREARAQERAETERGEGRVSWRAARAGLRSRAATKERAVTREARAQERAETEREGGA
ncbi:hypothetical protein GCM10010376_18230 [Streptomyces violaceusniger]